MSIHNVGQEIGGMSRQNIYIHLINAEKEGELNYEFGLKLKDKFGIVFQNGNLVYQNQQEEKTETNNEDYTYQSETKDIRDRLPLYNISAKAGIPYLVNTLDNVQIIDYISMPGYRDCIGWVQVKGDSMSGFVEEGEYIALKPATLELVVWGTPYFVIFNGDFAQEPIVKYIRKGDTKEDLILRSHNSNYQDMEVTRRHILQIFTVKGIAKIKHVR